MALIYNYLFAGGTKREEDAARAERALRPASLKPIKSRCCGPKGSWETRKKHLEETPLSKVRKMRAEG
jgi:hypothetical protein